VCSAGDFYGSGGVFNEPKAHFIAKAMSALGYDAVAIGDEELGFGLDKIIADVRADNLPVTCANITPRGDRTPVAPDTREGHEGLKAARRLGTVFPPYLVVTRGGTRFGFVGLLSPRTRVKAVGKASKTVNAISWAIADPVEWAEKVIPEVRKRADVVIVLAHMDVPLARKIARTVPGIDAMVIGHQLRSEPFAKPVHVGGTLLLKATSRGQNIGILSFDTDGRGIENPKNRIDRLDASYPDDPAMAKLVAEFARENRKQQKILYAKQQLHASKNSADDHTYVGLGACQSCHLAAFKIYKKTDHARAYRTLASQFSQRDVNCIGCHVTGYHQKGGFGLLRMRGSQTDLVDVQCEACHGPGANHSRDGRYIQAARQSCVRCHTPDEDPDFDFDRDWQKIKH